MKNRSSISTVVICVSFICYFALSACRNGEMKINKVNTSEQTSVVADTFTNCIFNTSFGEINNDWGLGSSLHVSGNLDKYRELNFNAVHAYDEYGSSVFGRVNENLTQEQIENFKHFLDSVKKVGGMKGFFERSFISKYCYGQRLIYEVPEYKNDITTNYGFVYRRSDCGTKETDFGRSVIHAIPGKHSPGYICRDIYENLQHGDLLDFRQRDKEIWFLKPVMRIPENTDPEKKVARIEIIPFGDTIPIKNITIKAGNFGSAGGYAEMYSGLERQLQISGKDTEGGLNNGIIDQWWDWDERCKVDFRMYWYGECEIWFDKLIVDDETANELFDTSRQPDIDSRIQKEVTNFTAVAGMYTFFTDEVMISQVSCMKYVMDKMRNYNPLSRLSFALTYNLHMHGLKNDNLSYRIYFDSLQPAIIQADHHAFYLDNENNGIKIPDVFQANLCDSHINQSWFISPEVYNDILQNKIIGGKSDKTEKNTGGSLIFEIIKTRSEISDYSKTTKFIMQPQLHSYIFADTISGLYKNGLREPTNEEIQVQAMVSIAHGADGLCWFIYNSRIWSTVTQIPKMYMAGLLNPANSISKREHNCYGQNKWKYVSEMNRKILDWIPVLESTDWVDGYSIHQSGADNYFIQDIKSIYKDASGKFPVGPSNTYCDNIKYWEAGYFLPKDKKDKSLYVLIVNRRCVPEISAGKGDLRMLKIRFKESELNNSNSWKIIDLSTKHEIIFDKNNQGSDGFVFLGDSDGDIGHFNPGEGKLFKIIPVLQ